MALTRIKVPEVGLGIRGANGFKSPKRTIDLSKPKVKLDGTADPTCIPCEERKKKLQTKP